VGGTVHLEGDSPSESPLAPQLPADFPFQALLDAAPDAIIIVAASGQIRVVNAQVEQLFGYLRAELLGKPVELLLPDSLRAAHIQHRHAYVAAPRTRPMGSGLDLAARRRDGSTFPVEISLSALTTANGPLITCVIRDVTERKRAEQALARQAAQLREQANLLELTQDTIIVRALDGTIRFWNHGAEELYGWSRTEAIGQLTHQLLRTRFPVSLADQMTTLLDGGQWEGELTYTRRDGSQVTVFSRQVLQNDDAGRPVAILEINTDITERKHAAEELERQVRQRTAHLNTLLQFSQELLTAHGLEEVLEQAMRHAMALVPEAQRGAIYLYEPGEGHLALRASAGFRELPDFSRTIDLGLIGRAFQSRRVQQADSTEQWKALVQEMTPDAPARLLAALRLEHTPTGAIAIPLLAHTTAIGVLVLLRTVDKGPFAAEARSTLEGLANLAAVAIQEARSVQAASRLTSQVADLEEQQRRLAERLTSLRRS
jgi:PAS domain S-box-containing protein